MNKSSARYICGCGFYCNDWSEFSGHTCKKTRRESRIKVIVNDRGGIETKAKKLWELV